MTRGTIKAGCDRFFAHVQSRNVLLFQRLHWRSLGEVSLHGQPHHRMEADLAILPRLAEAGLSKAAKDISQGGQIGTAAMLAECSEVGLTIDLDAVPRPEDTDLERWLLTFPGFGYLLTARPENPASSGEPACGHSATSFFDPSQTGDGAVLVIGSGQSGCQIAEDLHLAGKQVHLAVGSAPRVSRNYRGRDVTAWLVDMGHYALTVDDHPQGEAARKKANHYMTGRDGGREIDLRRLAREGMTLHGRLDLPALDEQGYPAHWRGVSTLVPNLYALGLPWLWTWGSGRFSAVGQDADYITGQIARKATPAKRTIMHRIDTAQFLSSFFARQRWRCSNEALPWHTAC